MINLMEAELIEKLQFVHKEAEEEEIKKMTLKKNPIRFTSHLILNSVLKSYKRSEKGQKGATVSSRFRRFISNRLDSFGIRQAVSERSSDTPE